MKKVLGLVVLAVLNAPGVYAAPADVTVIRATPDGITLQAPLRERRYDPNDPKAKKLPALQPRLDTSQPNESDYVYADASGMTLYSYTKDTAGKPSCDGECAKTAPAALAPAGAKVFGDWSLIAREGGARQWAYKNKPLYTSIKDKAIGQVAGAGAEWQTLAFRPTEGMKLPAGFTVEGVRSAGGQVLTDPAGKTIYVMDGNAKRKEDCNVTPCLARFIPVAAPELARAVGDFSIVTGDAAARQWAYRGQPLFTFGGDLGAGDAHGADVDGKWRPLMMVRYFMPSGAKIAYDAARGALLTTANGRTLYRQGATDHSQSSRSIPYARPGSPALGRAIGVADGCSGKCLTQFKPFRAPANAQPSGHWDIAVRADDGSRQWVYKSHALYTYVGDKKAGDFNGNDIFNIPAFDAKKPTDAVWVVGVQLGVALYWTFMAP